MDRVRAVTVSSDFLHSHRTVSEWAREATNTHPPTHLPKGQHGTATGTTRNQDTTVGTAASRISGLVGVQGTRASTCATPTPPVSMPVSRRPTQCSSQARRLDTQRMTVSRSSALEDNRVRALPSVSRETLAIEEPCVSEAGRRPHR
ncbi:hypothetical protein PSCLAVI8L_90122 [Pseudoclavibacter sp. 8L]|nr:hypothetical protein PSCLAVI8L_90122 [Pseudoclavibacter sp. 8L]